MQDFVMGFPSVPEKLAAEHINAMASKAIIYTALKVAS